MLAAEADGHPVVLHCFSIPEHLDEVVERGYMMSFAGRSTFPKALDLQAAARDAPAELLLVETDSPYLSPGARAAGARTAGQRRPHAEVHRRPARRHRGGARRPHHPQRRPRLRLVRARPRAGRVGVMRLLAAHGLRPDTDLGQHFLLDENLVDLAVRARRASARTTSCWRWAPASAC